MRRLKIVIAAASLAAIACSHATPEAKPGATPAAASPAPATAGWKLGDKVDVEWKEQWWKAVILVVLEKDTYKIHYVGYGPGYDEVVAAARIRARTAESIRGGSTEKE